MYTQTKDWLRNSLITLSVINTDVYKDEWHVFTSSHCTKTKYILKYPGYKSHYRKSSVMRLSVEGPHRHLLPTQASNSLFKPKSSEKWTCAFVFLLQVCNKREKRLSDPILEKYIINVVFDTINAFFSSPFSENSTSLQVSAGSDTLWWNFQEQFRALLNKSGSLFVVSVTDSSHHRDSAAAVVCQTAGLSLAAAAAPRTGGDLHQDARYDR